MIFDRLIIILLGTASILFVYWYFFAKEENVVKSQNNEIDIKVDAGYTPSMIEVAKGKTVSLKIVRTDPSDCLDQLIIPQWNIVKALPLNKEITITFTPDEVGEFPFHCGMNMFHGKIIVRESV